MEKKDNSQASTSSKVQQVNPGHRPITRSQSIQMIQEPDRAVEAAVPGSDGSSTETTTTPPSSPFPSPSHSPPPDRDLLSFTNQNFEDIAYYAERSHLATLAEPETASLYQRQHLHPELDPRTTFDIPGDPVSQRFVVLADAARTGHRNGEYSVPVVENVGGYFERAMHPLMNEIEERMKMLPLDEAAIAGVDDLIRDCEDGSI